MCLNKSENVLLKPTYKNAILQYRVRSIDLIPE